MTPSDTTPAAPSASVPEGFDAKQEASLPVLAFAHATDPRGRVTVHGGAPR